MAKVKKIFIYPLRSSGHTNVCVTIAKALLNQYGDQVEITFVSDPNWSERLSKFDDRFKFQPFEYERKEQESSVDELIRMLEPFTKLPLVDRVGCLYTEFDQFKEEEMENDRKVGDIFCEHKPDLILMDQMELLPSVIRAKCPYAFIVSANPLAINLSPNYPLPGSDASINDPQKVADFRNEFEPYMQKMIANSKEKYEIAKVKVDDDIIHNLHKPLSKHFTIYSFPREIDYYTDEVKKQNRLISIDTSLIPERVPPPFELPESFAKKQGKIVYVSLGSMFSMYYQLVQRLVDILATLPYRYIISKGAKGDNVTFPNDNFIGENYVNQLAVLQVADLMITHGGNNSLGECFYFGVPTIVMPVFVDQINNGKRIEETNFGVQLPIYEYKDEELKEGVVKLLNDNQIRAKWKAASERIQKEQKYKEVVDYIFNYI